MRRDLPPERDEFFRVPRRVTIQLVVMMDVDQHRQMVRQRIRHHEIRLGKNLRRERKSRPRPGVVLPANRHAHMVKTLAAHDGKFIRRARHAPGMTRRRFQIIAKKMCIRDSL